MWTIVWEIASQIGLRKCSEKLGVGGTIRIHVILVGGYAQSKMHFGRDLLLVLRRVLLVMRSSCFH